jgi:arylsulfatase A-like enzyme/Flp pilus assembly protein TadD
MALLRSVVFIICLVATATTCRVAAAGPRFNVVLITLDTVRADRLGCYGYSQARTPHVDQLARSGVLFEKAYSPVPITLPSHAVIMTGTYPMLNGVHDFSGNRLSPQQPTLASILKQHGYSTGAVLGSAVLDSRFGLDSGFDFYYDQFDFSRLLETNLDAMERPGNVVVDRGLEWLQQTGKQPFLLWLHLYDAHHPYTPPAPYGSQFRSRPYDGEIAFVDAQIGRVLQFLKSRKLDEQTLVIVVGDHGEGLGEHGEKTHGFFIYNSTLHVPLVVKLPTHSQSKRKRVAAPVTLVDLLPTVLEFLGLPAPAPVQGKSLIGLISGKKVGSSDLYAESFLPRLHFNWSETRALQAGNYRFIEAPKPELYDLSRDPGELHNLYSEKKALAQELRGRLKAVIRKYSSSQELADKVGLDPALAERLKSLGYLAVDAGGNPTASGHNLADPKDRIEMYELVSAALSEAQQGHYDSSIEKLQAALRIEETSVPVHYLLGLNYYRKREFSAGVTHFRRVLELSPDYTLAIFHLALSYGHLGEVDRAISLLKRTLELDPTHFSAAFNLGALYLKKEMIAEALEAFRRSVTIHPEYGPGHRALGEVLLYQGKVDDALRELREAARLQPSDSATHQALARALDAKGLHVEAMDALRKAESLAPGTARPAETRPF